MSWTRFGGSTKDAERFWVDLTPVVGEEYKLAFVPPTLAIVWDAYLDAQQSPVEGVPYNLLGILNVLSPVCCGCGTYAGCCTVGPVPVPGHLA